MSPPSIDHGRNVKTVTSWILKSLMKEIEVCVEYSNSAAELWKELEDFL